MKTIFLILIALFLSAQSYGLCLQNCDEEVSFIDKATKKITGKDDSENKYTGKIDKRESKYTLDLSGLAYLMPDQPAPDQFLTTFIEYGLTYKFSDKLHVAGKYVKLNLDAPKGIIWTHTHFLVGGGARSYFGPKDSQQWQINFLTGISAVEGTEGIGSVKNLTRPLFLDFKYLWTFGDNVMLGPQVTFGRVPTSCEDPNGAYLECGSGGYTSISLTIHIGIPEDWGN